MSERREYIRMSSPARAAEGDARDQQGEAPPRDPRGGIVDREVEDEIVNHHPEGPILRGAEIVEALGEKTFQEFEDCLRRKTRLKRALTAKMRVTEADMSNAVVDRPSEEVTSIQNTYMIGLMNMKLESIPHDRQEVDNNFIVIMAIIEESYIGPSVGEQWEAWDRYRGQMQTEWDDERIRIQKYATGLEEKREKLSRRHRGISRSEAGDYQPRWRVRTDLEPATIKRSHNKIRISPLAVQVQYFL